MIRLVVEPAWRVNTQGCKMYQVIQKLHGLELEIKRLNHHYYGNISFRVWHSQEELQVVQKELASDLLNPGLV
ncbi:hypothetical protein Ancab_004587 [Ancistrocladus abbreviatus]